MCDETKVLNIAASKTGTGGVVVYHDLDELKPPGARPHAGRWLHQPKRILKDNGYVCHERGKKQEWGKCGYAGPYTHFHKGSDIKVETPTIAVIMKCKRCGFEIRSDWKFCPHCGEKIV